MSDTTVIEFQKGNKESFRNLFNMLYPSMCLFANKFLKSYENSEDVAQEIFIELWNRRAKFSTYEQVKAFLYLSIKNRCLNFIKHLAVEEKFNQNELKENSHSIEEYIIEVDVIQQLYEIINNLPEQRKTVIQLSMQEMTNEEIAQNMNVSVNTVKLHKKIAYKTLRNKLGPLQPILLLLF
jgi:RNA polymerase sigma-70 factor (family 1)